jgi:hypothetical protein
MGGTNAGWQKCRSGGDPIFAYSLGVIVCEGFC